MEMFLFKLKIFSDKSYATCISLIQFWNKIYIRFLIKEITLYKFKNTFLRKSWYNYIKSLTFARALLPSDNPNPWHLILSPTIHFVYFSHAISFQWIFIYKTSPLVLPIAPPTSPFTSGVFLSTFCQLSVRHTLEEPASASVSASRLHGWEGWEVSWGMNRCWCANLQMSGCVLTCSWPIQPPHTPERLSPDCQSMFAQKYLPLVFSTLLAFIPSACVLFVCVFDKSV